MWNWILRSDVLLALSRRTADRWAGGVNSCSHLYSQHVVSPLQFSRCVLTAEIAGGRAEFLIRYSIPQQTPGDCPQNKRATDNVSTLSALFLADCPDAERVWRTQRARRSSPQTRSAWEVTSTESSFTVARLSLHFSECRFTHRRAPLLHKFDLCHPSFKTLKWASHTHLWFHERGPIFFSLPNDCTWAQGGARVPLCGALN